MIIWISALCSSAQCEEHQKTLSALCPTRDLHPHPLSSSVSCKGKSIINSRLLALSCFTCHLFCILPFSMVVLPRHSLNWRQVYRNTIKKMSNITLLFDFFFCCVVRKRASIQISAASVFLFSLTAYPPSPPTHTATHTLLYAHKMYNFFKYFPHLCTHTPFHTEIAAHV